MTKEENKQCLFFELLLWIWCDFQLCTIVASCGFFPDITSIAQSPKLTYVNVDLRVTMYVNTK